MFLFSLFLFLLLFIRVSFSFVVIRWNRAFLLDAFICLHKSFFVLMVRLSFFLFFLYMGAIWF